jgi:hypothetical protein
MNFRIYFIFFLTLFGFSTCEKFEDFNENPNEPTVVPADVLLPNAIRSSINTAVDASFLVGNNAAQLTAKTLRLEVDAYNWNAFPKYWEGWYESLTDITSIEKIAVEQGNEQLQGVAIVLRSWVFQNLTNAYGDIPYSEATLGAEDNFTPIYDSQESIYLDLLNELEKARILLDGGGSIGGDILLNGDPTKWKKFANTLRLRLLMYAGDKISDAPDQFKSIVDNASIISSNVDNVELFYTGSFPNEFPLIPLKIGDADAVAISDASLSVMLDYNDPRLHRYTRPNNDDFSNTTDFIGAINGQGDNCTKDGASRLGLPYYNYPELKKASEFGLGNANGIIITYGETELLLAEAAAKGWIDSDIESHYRNGIEASMANNQVDYATFGYTDFEDFYANSGVAYSEVTDIWEQKWLALFFHGLEPYFEVRRWYNESGNSFDGIPFLEAACGNLNNDNLPLRFLYPGEEQSLNADNYEAAIARIGSNNQNAAMWIVE